MRLCMVLLHAFFVGTLYFLDSDFRREIYLHRWYAVLYLIFVVTTVIQYWYTAGSNPGYVVDVQEEDQAETRMKSAMGRQSICSTCNVWQPPRSKHCFDCDTCVLQFDHHCVWLGTCVGHCNHCRFWWFLLEEVALCLWTSAMYVLTFSRTKNTSTSLHTAAIIILSIILLLLLMFLITLLLFHSYLVVTNQTTYELIRWKRIPEFRGLPDNVKPYSKGCVRNIYHFCCTLHNTHPIEEIPSRIILERRSHSSFLEFLHFHCC
eukprot:c20604_g1_i2 orf=278-1066(+)